MVKVTENWAATLRAMKVGDIVVFPVRAISSVNTTISRLRLEVTPCVGVWIETSNSVQTGWPISSHPAWVYMD